MHSDNADFKITSEDKLVNIERKRFKNKPLISRI